MTEKEFKEFIAQLLGGIVDGDPNEDNYKEIKKLDEMLTNAGIPHEFNRHMAGGYQIVYYGPKGKPVAPEGHIYGSGYGSVCSAIETAFSYGSENDRIEISGLVTKEEYKKTGRSVLGNLTAEDVFSRIKKHWEAEKCE